MPDRTNQGRKTARSPACACDDIPLSPSSHHECEGQVSVMGGSDFAPMTDRNSKAMLIAPAVPQSSLTARRHPSKKTSLLRFRYVRDLIRIATTCHPYEATRAGGAGCVERGSVHALK